MKTDEIINEIENIYRKEGKLPSIVRLVNLTGESSEKIQKIYKHFLHDGKFIKIKDERKTVNVIKSKLSPNLIIRYIMGFVGVILVTCSVHFTYEFNVLTMNKFWAFMISLSIILFTSLAFTVAALSKEKASKIILWIIGVFYSIFTAMAGQYNNFRSYTSADNSQAIIMQSNIYNDQLKELKMKKNELNHWRLKETEYTNNPDLKIENPSTWKQIRNGVNELKIVENKIENVENKLVELSGTDTEKNKTIYHWLSEVLHVSADWIQFIIIVFPSVFLDLCAGICLKFAFVPIDKKENL